MEKNAVEDGRLGDHSGVSHSLVCLTRLWGTLPYYMLLFLFYLLWHTPLQMASLIRRMSSSLRRTLTL